MQRDRIDFGTTDIRTLFVRQLVPTILGMVSTALFIITDGIFVGRGIGSDGLAAINIAAPLSMIATGLGLMFGMGGAIVASINLSRGKNRVANINATQTLIVSCSVTIFIALLAVFNPELFSRIMGAEGHLVPLAAEYLFWYGVFLVFIVICNSMPFFVRMSRPRFAMWTLLLAAIINIVLDYLFIFVFEWGLTGAAIATGVGQITASVLFIGFLNSRKSMIRLTRFKATLKSIRLTLRNTGYIIRLGFSSFLSEVTVAVIMLVGNYVFIRHLGAEGVAAYSIICYLIPVLFMLFNGVIQSAQPIISYNYGSGQVDRYSKAFRMALTTGILAGLAFTAIMAVFSREITSVFVTDPQSATAGYARVGLPLFSLDLVFFAVNMVCIGYYMSIEKTVRAILITTLRGILPVITFFTLPSLWGVTGIWLAVPVGEMITTSFIVTCALYDRKKNKGRVKAANAAILPLGGCPV